MTVPANWAIRSLGEVADTALGKMLDRGKPRGLREVPYLRNVNVQWDRIDTSDLLTMELADHERDRFKVAPGDLLVCEGGEIGRAAIWQGTTEYLAYQKALHRIRPSDAVLARHLLHLFHYLALSGRLAAYSTGTTILHLPQQRLRQLPIPVPPIEEQRRIVDVLEDHLSRLDAGLTNLATAEARLRMLTAATLDHEVTADETASLASLSITADYGTSSKCVPDGPGPAVVRIPNLVNGRIDLSDEKRVADPSVDVSTHMLSPDDLLVVRTNGSRDLIGRSAVVQGGVEAAFASYLIRFRLDTRLVLPGWVNAVLGSPAMRVKLEALAASSAGQYNLSLGKLGPLQVPLPSLAEQRRALAVVDDQRAATARLRSEIGRISAQSAQLRRALLNAAFSGKLTGTHSDFDRDEEAIS